MSFTYSDKKNERAPRIFFASALANQMDGNTPDNPQRSYRSLQLLPTPGNLSSPQVAFPYISLPFGKNCININAAPVRLPFQAGLWVRTCSPNPRVGVDTSRTSLPLKLQQSANIFYYKYGIFCLLLQRHACTYQHEMR